MRIAALACVLAACSPQSGPIETTCPPSPPPTTQSCREGLSCEWGGKNGLCTTIAKCTGGTWDVTAPSPDCGTNAPSCPATISALSPGSACPLTTNAECTYPEGVCACTNCRLDGGAASTEWTCRTFGGAPSAGPDCPATRPPLGSACTTEGADCDWSCCESISFGPDEICQNGLWTESACTAFCPAAPLCL